MTITTTGTCKFCHQIRTIDHAKEDYTQAERDEIATHECSCEGAKEQRELDYRMEKGRNAIEKIVRKRDQKAATIFLAGLKATAEGRIQSIQIKSTDGMRYQMVRKDSKITIKSIETNEEESDGDAVD